MNIKEDPYNYICDYAESMYPQTGRQVFEVLCLLPPSLIIPDLPYKTSTIRSNINAMFLANSGSGKSSLAKMFAHITYNPLEVESITPAKLEAEIMKNPTFSLIIGDFARMSKDTVINKVLEGVMGEEKKLNRKTMRVDNTADVNGIALLCGVATDLHFYILGGLIFRCVPIFLGHDPEQHSKIGEYLKNQIGSYEEVEDRETIIKEYYNELARIQGGKHEKIKPIKNFHISKEFRDKSYELWDKMTQRIIAEIGFSWFREYQEFFRFLCASAFLNVFNRKIKDNVLYPNDEDFKIALDLMKKSIKFKYRLMNSEKMSRGIKSAREFEAILRSKEISEEYKEILRNIRKKK